ncbi:MAG: carboxypeptidase regulatory-like domain-containing protein [Planctomycetes bacterium]|nr:carboxypeptidase regulatory-like domain-containing protein [Planctomycetota bacterium]
MHRSLAFALVLLLAAVVGGLWLLWRGDTAPPAPPAAPPTATTNATEVQTGPLAAGRAAADHHVVREMIAAKQASLLDDPEFVAGLTGFKGRVIDHGKAPVADCGVRMYRGALDSVLPEGLDLFADEQAFSPQYIAGETRTAGDGTFLITHVRPQGFYLLFAGIGTDAPMHQIVTRLPSPGEVVDLGDIELPDAGVITGIVLDDNGDPLPGALVRAADLPGSLAAFFPIERFDPQGAVLLRESNAPVHVVEMPSWVEPAFEQLPIPSTVTGSDGAFRLVGVTPGSNLLATTQRGFLSDMKPSIQVRAGQVKDVGRIRLKRGEELSGRVLDTAGKPVAGAEILAGSTIAMGPVDLAQRLEPADAEGRFGGHGFAPGKVTVAARRGKGHPWVLAEPQPVFGEVTVTLPATFAVTATITLADGKPATAPRMRVLQGKAGDGAAEMHMLGFVPPIDLTARQQPLADGQWRIDNLQPGVYTLVADAPGHATAFAPFEIATADVAVALQLSAPNVFHVVVVDPDNRPVRNATVFAEARGKRLVEMPVNCGRTGADGRIDIDELQGESLRVSAEHPRWGVVHGETKPGEELRLQMLQPGSLRGFLFENGKPPPPGKFSIACVRRRGDGPRGPLDTVPGLLTPGLDGAFAVKALQPGSYDLQAFDAIDTLHSPGGVMALAQNAFLMRDRSEVRVEIAPGQLQEVVIEAGEKPIEGPTASLAGSLTVNGRLGVDHGVMVYANDRRFSAKVDERGRFDLGTVPAGEVWVSVNSLGESGMFLGGGGNLWSANLTLKAGEVRELTIELSTSSVAGFCYRPDGSPAAGVYVQAQGMLKSGGDRGHVWIGTPTDATGAFQFKQVAAGTYSFEVRGNGDEPLRGTLEGVEVTGSMPVDSLRIELQKAMQVKGRLDLSVFAQKQPRWGWIGFYRMPKDGSALGLGDFADSAGVAFDDGAFSTEDLAPGQYRLRLHVHYDGDRPDEQYECMDVVVPPAGLDDLQVRPGRIVPD